MEISKETIINLLWGRRKYDFQFHTVSSENNQKVGSVKTLHTFLLALIVISYVPKAVNEFKNKCVAVTPLWVSGNAQLSSYSVYQGIIFCLTLSFFIFPIFTSLVKEKNCWVCEQGELLLLRQIRESARSKVCKNKNWLVSMLMYSFRLRTNVKLLSRPERNCPLV